MTQSRLSTLLMGAIFLLAAGGPVFARPELSVKDLVKKNLAASGGRDKIAAVKSYSFRTGNTVYYTGADGKLRIATGKQPVVTEVILVSPDRVQRNRFGELTEIGGLEKSIYQFQAKLQAGFFTLTKFAAELTPQGLRSFGPEKFYVLMAQQGSLKVSFYLQASEFWIKRIVLQGTWESGLKYEANYDFAPYQQVDGLRFPTTWFASFVGMRGNLFEVQGLTLNPNLDPALFSRLDINIGRVEAETGRLRGNVLDSMEDPQSLILTTNWTKKSVEKAGLGAGDRWLLTLGGAESDIVYLTDIPSPDKFPSGAGILTFNPQFGDTAAIIFFKTDFSRFRKLAPLAALQIRKK